MAIQPLKNIIILVLFILVASCSVIKAGPARSAHPVNKEANTCQAKQIPNAELERVHSAIAPAGQMAVQKNFVSDLLSATVFHQPGIVAGSSFIKASSLLVKDHLIHNYPSHNFW